MTRPQPIAAISVSVVHHVEQDRLAFVATAADGTQAVLMVTRRLAIRLVNGFAHLLERTSPAASEVPAHARGDVVMFEHQGAIAAGAAAGAGASAPRPARAAPMPGGAAVARQTVAPALMHALDVKVHPDRFVLVLRAADGEVARMDLSRGDLHRFVALLRRKCDEADWRVPIETGWLDLEAGSMTLN